MFRQSIDPRGAFPPKSSKKPVGSGATQRKKKKKKPIKRRKRTRDRFGAERKQEQVFKFGEARSGLSGRQIFKPQEQSNFNPADYLRIHQSAIANQLREQVEKKATGGTFTGTSIGEERRVREAQQADREFRRQEADTRRRFVGAVEKLVDKVSIPTPAPAPAPTILPAPAPAPIILPDREIVEELRDIKRELKKKPVPVIKFGDADPIEEVEVADIEEIDYRRPPEDDINYLSSTRSKRTPTAPPPIPAPRPSPSNPIDAKGRAEIEAIRTGIIATPFKAPQPEPEPQEEETPEGRRKLFLEEQEDTDEFLTPTGNITSPISIDRPTEIPIIPPPLTAGIPQPTSDTDIQEIAKKVKAKKVKEEQPRKPNPANERQEGETEQDFLDRIGKIPDPSTAGKPAEEIKLEARLEQYKELAKFGQNYEPGQKPKSFDDEKKHYRLEILEDIVSDADRADYLGATKRNKQQFKKGDQYRLKNVEGTEGNIGYNFYRRSDGLIGGSKLGVDTFKINFGQKDKNIQRAIKEGKIKISLDEFDDEI